MCDRKRFLVLYMLMPVFICGLGNAFLCKADIVINTFEELAAIGTAPDKPLTGKYQLGKNIDASASQTLNGGQGWVPIGSSSAPFTGSFNGNGYAIENLYINRPAASDQGLFGYVFSASSSADITTIENLKVVNAVVKGKNQVGIIAGQCFSTVGRILIKNCYSSGAAESLNSGNYCGGLIGVTARTIVQDCSSDASVLAYINAGGLIGQSGSSYEYNGSISGPSVIRCFAKGGVAGTFAVGGLIGRINGGQVEDCYALGNVHGGTGWSDWSGGFVGFNNSSSSSISRCYSAGDVANRGKAGAFIGSNNGAVVDSFYCLDAITDAVIQTRPANSGSSVGITGITSAQMRQINTFSAWDIVQYSQHSGQTWWIKEDQTYPRLKYETQGIEIALSAPSDSQIVAQSSLTFSALLTTEAPVITYVVLYLNGVEYHTGDLWETSQYGWQQTVSSLPQGQYQWYIVAYGNDGGTTVSTVSDTRGFEIDYSYISPPVPYTPESKPTMVIIDDDGAEGVYSDLRVTADSYGVAISPAILLKYDASTPEIAPVVPQWGWGSMTITQVQEMNANGHSIISHGSMHTSHGVMQSQNPFTAGAAVLDGGSTFNGRFSKLHAQTNVSRGLPGLEVEIWENSNPLLRETVYITDGGRYSVYDRNNPSSPNGWDITPVILASPLVNSYSSPMAAMSVAETDRICQEVLAGFAAANLPRPRHYVLPFNGVPDDPQLNKLLEYFDTVHYEGTFAIYGYPLKELNARPFLLQRKLIDGVTEQAVMDDILDQIIAYQGLGFVYLHANYGGTPLFGYLISKALERDVEILGFDKAWAKFRYKLFDIYPAMGQQIANPNGTVDLSLSVEEAKDSSQISVKFYDVSGGEPVFISSSLIAAGQTASASLAIAENQEYRWFATIGVVEGVEEISVKTTETYEFNTKRNYAVVFDAGEHGQIVGGDAIQTVIYGQAAVAPVVEPQSGWSFAGWDTNFDFVTGNLNVSALYSQSNRIIALEGDLEFGDILCGSDGSAVLTISNSGTSPLTVSAIDCPEGFSGSWSGIIEAGGFEQVQITFSPLQMGDYGGIITVSSDAENSANTIECAGTGVKRIISLSGQLHFGRLDAGENQTLGFYITNSGNRAITVSGVSVPAGFVCDWTGVVAAGQSQEVPVSFYPASQGNYGGNIDVLSDKTEGTASMSCTGFVFYGEGTPSNPYLISEILHLEAVNQEPAASYMLTCDINLDGIVYDSAVIAPFSDESSPVFSGTFNGGGFAVRNLTISGTGDYNGLFGSIATAAIIENLDIVDASVSGSDFTAALAGLNNGIISGCSVTAAVTAVNFAAVFAGDNNGQISDCYSGGSAIAQSVAGGFAAFNNGLIADSYSTAAATADLFAGGFAGINTASVSGCFWDIAASNQPLSSGGAAKTTEQMRSPATFINAGWNYQSVWKQIEGGRPIFIRQYYACDFDGNDLIDTDDFMTFAAQWLVEGQDVLSDINCDGTVNLLDFNEMALMWMN